jgi:hypothetical protein
MTSTYMLQHYLQKPAHSSKIHYYESSGSSAGNKTFIRDFRLPPPCSCDQGCSTNPVCKVALATKFCNVAPNFMSLQYGNGFILPFRRLEFHGDSKIFGKCLQPWLRPSLCWDLTRRGLVVTGVSEEHIGSVLEKQAVQVTKDLLSRI